MAKPKIIDLAFRATYGRQDTSVGATWNDGKFAYHVWLSGDCELFAGSLRKHLIYKKALPGGLQFDTRLLDADHPKWAPVLEEISAAAKAGGVAKAIADKIAEEEREELAIRDRADDARRKVFRDIAASLSDKDYPDCKAALLTLADLLPEEQMRRLDFALDNKGM